MAINKKTTPVKSGTAKWQLSWSHLFIAASVAANIGFVVVIITMMISNKLDGMFMNEGLKRYCLSENNDKFAGSTDQVKALRDYTCASGDAKMYFNDGLQKYMNAKGVKE